MYEAAYDQTTVFLLEWQIKVAFQRLEMLSGTLGNSEKNNIYFCPKSLILPGYI